MDKKTNKLNNKQAQTKRGVKSSTADEQKAGNEKNAKKNTDTKDGTDPANATPSASSSAVPKKPLGEKNTLEHRLDYVCNFLNLKKE